MNCGPRFLILCLFRNSLVGDSFPGNWATVGVLTEKGIQKTSSNGKSYCIWKIGCLDENTVSLFLFGDAYQKNSQEKPGTVFALFNCSVRKDPKVLICYELVTVFQSTLTSYHEFCNLFFIVFAG